jgi:hypothetical protein
MSTLLYRYFFFGWLFRDVNRGNLLERAAAWRHNREQSRWLPTYARRWTVLGAALCALGGVVEALVAAPVASAVFYLPGALSVPVNAIIGAAWLGFRTFAPPA